jgi:hypothetical protein
MGVSAMSEYRAYKLEHNRIAGPPSIVVADNDQEAIERAKQLVGGHDRRIMVRARLIAGIKSADATSRLR